jgi:hypothetical protein
MVVPIFLPLIIPKACAQSSWSEQRLQGSILIFFAKSGYLGSDLEFFDS